MIVFNRYRETHIPAAFKIAANSGLMRGVSPFVRNSVPTLRLEQPLDGQALAGTGALVFEGEVLERAGVN